MKNYVLLLQSEYIQNSGNIRKICDKNKVKSILLPSIHFLIFVLWKWFSMEIICDFIQIIHKPKLFSDPGLPRSTLFFLTTADTILLSLNFFEEHKNSSSKNILSKYKVEGGCLKWTMS